MRSSLPATIRRRFLGLTTVSTLLLAGSVVSVHAQMAPAPVSAFGSGNVSLALTFDAAHSTITNPVPFWLYGGGAELSANLYHGLGAAANITGLHTGNSGGGVPINLLVATFGPRYTRNFTLGHRSSSVYGEGLIGEANGFNGVYPQTSGAISSSNSFALQVGGGLDLGLTRHLSVRVIEASWIRSQLPNATTNVQNNVRVGAGVVVHTAKAPK